MDFLAVKNHKSYIIAGILVLFAAFAFWLRILPLLTMGNVEIINHVAMDDPFYNLRQVEQMLANFPQYGWFDAMTYYPTGAVNYWGPLFPLIVSICCILTGATTRPEIISTALFVPPLMAVATIFVMYYVGKCFGDWKTGLLAAGFTAIISGQFFYRSSYGYLDHHIAEVLFSTLFVLLYSYAILAGKESILDLRNLASWKKPALLALLAGIAYLLGLFVMPTMILFAMIVGIFTFVQMAVDYYRGGTAAYLPVINLVVFVVASLGLVLFGFKVPGLGLSTYSPGHIVVYAGLILGTFVLYYLAEAFSGKPRFYYFGSIAGIIIALIAAIAAAVPDVFAMIVSNLHAFFGQEAVTDTVLEAMGWTPVQAWDAFNYGLVLFIAGAIILLYRNIRDEHPHQVFALIWSVVIAYATCQHIRYEYYLAINIALLAAVAVALVIGLCEPEIRKLLSSPAGGSANASEDPAPAKKPGKPAKKQQKKPAKAAGPDPLIVLPSVLVVILAILFVWSSATFSYAVMSARTLPLNTDWKESLDWMGKNTPDTGVDYYKIYNQATFTYPNSSYGVMSWWDYGHMITYIAKRIPNANPFQQGVAGPNGAAAFFITTSEDQADAILEADGTRYVVTDYMMDWGKFGPMATWYNTTAKNDPYMVELYYVNPAQASGEARLLILNRPLYYQTMISRLHNFDGSMTRAANTSYYIEYADSRQTGLNLPVVTDGVVTDTRAAIDHAAAFNLNAPAGRHAEALGSIPVAPLTDVPALRHYRLIHESPHNSLDSNTIDLKFVKIFEHVKGARIRGTGTIEVPVTTNTGRQFVYRQDSTGGEFVVPYATTGSTGEVKAVGPYRIAGTGRTFDVPESAVMQGLAIN